MDPDKNTTTTAPAPGFEITIKPAGKKPDDSEDAFIRRVVSWKGVKRNGKALECSVRAKKWFYRRHVELCKRLLLAEQSETPAAQTSNKSQKAKEEEKE